MAADVHNLRSTKFACAVARSRSPAHSSRPIGGRATPTLATAHLGGNDNERCARNELCPNRISLIRERRSEREREKERRVFSRSAPTPAPAALLRPQTKERRPPIMKTRASFEIRADNKQTSCSKRFETASGRPVSAPRKCRMTSMRTL